MRSSASSTGGPNVAATRLVAFARPADQPLRLSRRWHRQARMMSRLPREGYASSDVLGAQEIGSRLIQQIGAAYVLKAGQQVVGP